MKTEYPIFCKPRLKVSTLKYPILEAESLPGWGGTLLLLKFLAKAQITLVNASAIFQPNGEIRRPRPERSYPDPLSFERTQTIYNFV